MTRFAYVMSACFATMAITVTAFIHPAPRLIWNASASIPVGLYSARPATSAKVGDLVALTPPADLAALLAQRHYLPRGLPLLKPVAAIARQRVCRVGTAVSIDGHRVADTLSRDRRGRLLPIWQGCRLLGKGELFVMNPASRDSFDGRYFGPLPISALRAKLRPVWVYAAASAQPSHVVRR
ncbi:MAG: S26 family signal peptidase [Sphingomonas sp.]